MGRLTTATLLADSGLDATSCGIGSAEAAAISVSSAEDRPDGAAAGLASTCAVVWIVSGVGVGDENEADRKLENAAGARDAGADGTLAGTFPGTLAIDSTFEVRARSDPAESVDSAETVGPTTGSLDAKFQVGMELLDEADIEFVGL